MVQQVIDTTSGTVSSRLSSAVFVALLATVVASSTDAQSRVPSWDARGSGLLPRQGIACLDVADDGTIVVGTIASAGQPNVIALDGSGRILFRQQAGERWIGDVAAVSRGRHYALCTTPAGRAEDFPTVFAFGEKVVEVPPQLGQSAYPRTVFHYGEHSNHTGTHVVGFSGGAVALYGNRLMWLDQPGSEATATASIPLVEDAVTVSLAVHHSGVAVAGFAITADTSVDRSRNLFVLEPGRTTPLWSRQPVTEVGKAAPPEKGRYGTPTLPDGTRGELPQNDSPVFAPLSIAVDREPQLTRIATADYRGWQRWIRSSATGREQNYGTRFVPTQPTVTVYDSVGQTIRRFEPGQFKTAGWIDLAFLPGAKQLVAWPHHWTCRGLAGQTMLPVDDDSRTIWLLDINSGAVQSLELPDAVGDLAIADDGTIAATCWDGRLYRFAADAFQTKAVPDGTEVGGPALVEAHPEGGFVVARTSGDIRVLNSSGETVAAVDLAEAIQPTTPTWVADAKAERIADGVWQLPGGRVESDLGGQRIIEAPDGLILIEGHAGLSFEREWAAIEAAGLNPRRVRYVLATHEHGDHAPGAYLWRVATGAQFVCSDEMAYTLQHHIPLSTGYGLHPPIPTDITLTADRTLNLAGLQVRAVRLPGHTAGSMGWLFQAEDKRYLAIGDLIMPDGVLGYAGSINFSATDVLSSLRKIDALGVDFVLPGHGPITGPDRYIAAGIGVGQHVGWGRIRPEEPDPRFRLTQDNVQVVAWNIGAASADIGDFNGDSRPDIAVVTPTDDEDGSRVHVFLNHSGTFRTAADHILAVPDVSNASKLRVRELNGDGVLDVFVGGQQSALLLSAEKFPAYDLVALGLSEGNQVRQADVDGDGRPDILVNRKFGVFERVAKDNDGRTTLLPLAWKLGGPYADLLSLDLNGDNRNDLVSSYGHVLLRDAQDKLPADPSLTLPTASERDWSCLGAGDFNGDSRPDVTLTSYGQGPVKMHVFYNRGDVNHPFGDSPDATIDLDTLPIEKKINGPMLRDSVPAADFNGDGIDDLIVGKGQDQRILVLTGGLEGLSLERSTALDLDYRLHYETCLFPADFNGDGRLDIAALGNTKTGVGAGGPLAVYVYLQ
ncbi:MBL fold metallo-hydrolase [bacterium]|nr:MBL fold metallo-hydrolase [bacterium]